MSEEKKQPNPILVGILTAAAAFAGYYLVHVYIFKKEFQTQDYIIAIGIGMGIIVANYIQKKKVEKKKQDDILDDK